MILAIKNNI